MAQGSRTWGLVSLLLSLALLAAGCYRTVDTRPRVLPSPAAHEAAVDRPPGPRPNILLISTDDQNVDDLRWMPQTRRVLADAGMEMTDALSPHPLCCPARASILTGEYGQNNGVQHNHGPYGGYAALAIHRNLGSWLQAAGYDTGFVGKFLNGYGKGSGRPPGWTIWNPMVAGTYSYYGTQFYEGGSDPRYSVDVVGQRTVDYVRRLAAGPRPFFLWSSQVAPHALALAHGQWGPPPAPAEARVAGARAPSPAKPSFDLPSGADRGGVGSEERWTSAYIEQYFTQRLRALQPVDRYVAAAVRALADAGRLDDTYIFFITDNAYLLGEHGFIGKNLPFEEDLRIPMLVRGPGIPAGARSALPVTVTDLAPTFLEIAGATPGVVQDGRSFLATLHGKEQPWRDTQLIQGGSRSRSTHGWAFRGVRTARYTYVREVGTGREWLYDRGADPYELTNLAPDPRYAAIRGELSRRTTLLVDCSGATCNPRFGDPGSPAAPPGGVPSPVLSRGHPAR